MYFYDTLPDEFRLPSIENGHNVIAELLIFMPTLSSTSLKSNIPSSSILLTVFSISYLHSSFSIDFCPASRCHGIGMVSPLFIGHHDLGIISYHPSQ